MADQKQNQKLLAQILRTALPDQLADPEAWRGVQRSPGTAVQTAVAHPITDDDQALPMRPGEVMAPTTYIDNTTRHVGPQPDVNVYGHVEHLPENGGMEMGTNDVGDPVQRMPTQTVHPHWQMLHDIIDSMTRGRAPNPEGVHNAGDEG